MGKMLNLLMLVFAIEFALYAFPGSSDSANNSLFQFLFNPQEFLSNSFCFKIGCAISSNAILGGIQALMVSFITIAGISAGTGFIFKQDSVIFATISGLFGVVSLITLGKLWDLVYSHSGGAVTSGIGNQILATIVTAPFFIMWIIVVIDFIRGRD